MVEGKKFGLALIVSFVVICVISFIFLFTIYQSISELRNEKQGLEDELSGFTSNLEGINSKILVTKNNITQIRSELNDTFSELELRKSDSIYEMNNPTYSEVWDFIRRDTTNYKDYNAVTFNCGHYSLAVNNNSESKGIRCALVIVNFSGGAVHALVAFNTTDKGILYIEPQSDEKVLLEVGKDYWADCVVDVTSSYYYPANPDNIVENYE
ncbi:MAG: hypothetical protein MUO82_08045, partial [Candidatus Thermoplasmatota archaeon]|nr:hypothetical protein [Candidatus Thermoplasmatota archaeon]